MGEESDSAVHLVTRSGAELFHAPDKTPFLTVAVNSHRETYRIRSSGFQNWLDAEFFEQYCWSLSAAAKREAVSVLEAMAKLRGPELPVFVRCGGCGDKTFLDLCNDDWSVVEVTADGWHVEAQPPVRFHRPAGLGTLPAPEPGGTLDELRQFTTVRHSVEWQLLVGWLIGATSPRGPYPLLALTGSRGPPRAPWRGCSGRSSIHTCHHSRPRHAPNATYSLRPATVG